MVDEGKWVDGDSEDRDQDEEYELGWEITDWIDVGDLPYIAVALGLLSCLMPWWAGVSLAVALMSTNWLFFIAAVLFVCGTVLNLRNPIGMIGQIAGIVVFLIEVAVQYFKYRDEYGFDIGHPEIGILFAILSVTLCFLSVVYNGYDFEGSDQ